MSDDVHDRRAGDGLRHPGLPRTSSPTTPTSAGAGRRPPSCSPSSSEPLRRDRRHLAAGPAHRGPAGRHRRRRSTSAAGPVRGGARPEARRAVHRGRRGRPGRRGRRATSSAWCWRRTTRVQRRPVPGRPAAAAEPHGITVPGVESWHLEPAYVDFLAGVVRERLAGCPSAPRCSSPPTRCPSACSSRRPVPRPAAASAPAVAERVGLAPWSELGHRVAVRRRTPEPWRAPTSSRSSRPGRHRAGRRRAGVPQGFVADHLEVLYDLDIEAKARAEQRGLAFGRTPCVNDDPAVLAALAGRVLAMGRSG
jgi:hypothetical protein